MARIYVGNLPMDVRVKDVEDIFFKYGRIIDIDLKTPSRPPAFAFVFFEDLRDAEDAVRGRDGVEFEGQRLRVEMSHGGRGGGPPPRGGGGGGGGGYEDRRGRGPPGRDLKRSEYRVIVSGLPQSCSWQDLKDFMRQAGDVIYTDVDRQGGGIVEFSSRSDQEYAIKKLDDTEFSNKMDKAYVRVKPPRGQGRDRSRSRSRSRSRDRSGSRGRRNRSGSRSPRRERGSPRRD